MMAYVPLGILIYLLLILQENITNAEAATYKIGGEKSYEKKNQTNKQHSTSSIGQSKSASSSILNTKNELSNHERLAHIQAHHHVDGRGLGNQKRLESETYLLEYKKSIDSPPSIRDKHHPHPQHHYSSSLAATTVPHMYDLSTVPEEYHKVSPQLLVSRSPPSSPHAIRVNPLGEKEVVEAHAYMNVVSPTDDVEQSIITEVKSSKINMSNAPHRSPTSTFSPDITHTTEQNPYRKHGNYQLNVNISSQFHLPIGGAHLGLDPSKPITPPCDNNISNHQISIKEET